VPSDACCGPGAGVAWLILEGHHGAALGVLAVAGVSDWADGYVAKRWGQASVVGSYLDPAADKVLIGCTVAALAYEARLPARPGRNRQKELAAFGAACCCRRREPGTANQPPPLRSRPSVQRCLCSLTERALNVRPPGRAAAVARGPDPGPRRPAGRRRLRAPVPRAGLARARLVGVLPHPSRARGRWRPGRARRGRRGGAGAGRGCRLGAARAICAAAAGEQGQHGAAAGAGGRVCDARVVRLAARGRAVGAGRRHGRDHRCVNRSVRARIPQRHAAEVTVRPGAASGVTCCREQLPHVLPARDPVCCLPLFWP